MDPIEAGDWIAGRPLQLVFLSGLDPTNKPHHNSIVTVFRNRTADKQPLQIRVVSGELDIPPKREENSCEKGILRRDWPLKYLEKVPALIVVFIDLEWNHPSWEEKKTEAESKVASIRASLRHGTKVALILIQQKPTSVSDNVAADRAHELCQACSLSSKQLFILPADSLVSEPNTNSLQNFTLKLEAAFHELCQSFYQQRLKSIRSRSIPNNSPALMVRQQFKLAFLSELRQDTHTALRNYRLAYDQCKDTVEQWDAVDVFEWRSVVGLLNYKMCELCFLHSTALESINQMRRHTSIFFSSAPGIYPTPHLASIEHLLWKSKQCYQFAHLFEKSVISGLSALATLNPGTHLDQAANVYAAANVEILALKRSAPQNLAYPTPDPLANASSTVFFGQRPWRIGYEGLASAEVEAAAVNAITQRLVVNHEGVISLLSAALAQYQKYGCLRMKKKVMMEMANTCYANNEIQRALRFWGMVIKDGALPYSFRKDMMHRATWAAYAITSVQDFMACCMQLMCPAYAEVLPSSCATCFSDILNGIAPGSPFPSDDIAQEQLQSYRQQWQRVIMERSSFVVQASKLAEIFLEIRVSFLDDQTVDQNSKVAVRVEVISKADSVVSLNDVIVHLKSKQFAIESSQSTTDESLIYDPIRLGKMEVCSKKPMQRVVLIDLKNAQCNWIVTVSKVTLDLGNVCRGQIEFDENALNRNCLVENIVGLEFLKIGGDKSSVKLDNSVNVDCLIGEVTKTELVIRNTSKKPFHNLQLDFKRQEQKRAEAAAVLFVEKEGTELKSEFSFDVCEHLNSGDIVSIPLMFAAQLIGDYVLQLELSYKIEDDLEKKTILEVAVNAKDPFIVSSTVLNINGIPMSSILNNCEHILSVQIQSAASIIIDSVEFLMADVATLCDPVNGFEKNLNDKVNANEVICYSAALRVSVKEDESETPLGRMSIEWKRAAPNTIPVRSVVPLCRIPVIPCPIAITSHIKTNPTIVRQPIEICFELTSHSEEVIEISINFDLNDVFMFSGERKITLTVLPSSTRRMNVIVMALSAGRLNFPKISLKSVQVPDLILQQSLRTLPATIFVLPKSKDSTA
uniref:Trafficking protein particle complex subunit 11 n=1 Tax=Caenorhabditis tropicalis TaxID=1561998 RepID=A0A1I7UJS1_9PELO